MKELDDLIKYRAINRADKFQDTINEILGAEYTHLDSYIIAGGSLAGEGFNDIDVFPVDENKFYTLRSAIMTMRDVDYFVTPNATTITHNKTKIQLCNYHKNSLKELVDSFDFAHIQVGAKLENKDGIVNVRGAYYTGQFVAAQVSGKTKYMGSEYPMSSLVRMHKYAKRDLFSSGGVIRDVIEILADITQRGFKDYDDFKDQLDAVDLGLLPEQYKELNNNNALLAIFNNLDRSGNGKA